ncbi:MAG: preprotein translocase subunit SecG [Corallococcus sp.]|nr:preprotein translocase subunit SecG [Corallococcus sp.]
MLNIIAFFEINTTALVSGIKIALAALALVCAVFIIFIVMKQSGNSDGMEAMTGSSKNSDESETYYGKNAGSRREARLKVLTYVATGLLAVCCLVLLILNAFIK